MLWERGLLRENGFGRLQGQHGLLHGLSVELCEGVSDGDWERTVRLISR